MVTMCAKLVPWDAFAIGENGSPFVPVFVRIGADGEMSKWLWHFLLLHKLTGTNKLSTMLRLFCQISLRGLDHKACNLSAYLTRVKIVQSCMVIEHLVVSITSVIQIWYWTMTLVIRCTVRQSSCVIALSGFWAMPKFKSFSSILPTSYPLVCTLVVTESWSVTVVVLWRIWRIHFW